MRTLIRVSHVLTLDPRQPAIANGGVLIEGERIIAVDTVDALRKSPGIEKELGTDDTWIMPGFVNAHYHHDRVFSMVLLTVHSNCVCYEDPDWMVLHRKTRMISIISTPWCLRCSFCIQESQRPWTWLGRTHETAQ